MEIKKIGIIDAVGADGILYFKSIGYFKIFMVKSIKENRNYVCSGSDNKDFLRKIIDKIKPNNVIDVELSIRIINYKIQSNNTSGNNHEIRDSLYLRFASIKELKSCSFDWMTSAELIKPMRIQDLEKGKKYLYCGQLPHTEMIINVRKTNKPIAKEITFDKYLETISGSVIANAIDENGENIKLSSSDYVLSLPDDYKCTNYFKDINRNLNEYKLNPQIFVSKNRESSVTTINVCWEKQETAVRYVVSIYAIKKYCGGWSYPVHLKDYELGRSESLLVINNITFSNYIIKVIAEANDGKMIAESRGITSVGLPINL